MLYLFYSSNVFAVAFSITGMVFVSTLTTIPHSTFGIGLKFTIQYRFTMHVSTFKTKHWKRLKKLMGLVNYNSHTYIILSITCTILYIICAALSIKTHISFKQSNSCIKFKYGYNTCQQESYSNIIPLRKSFILNLLIS